MVDATVKAFAPDADSDARPHEVHAQDADDVAYGLFEQDYGSVVHAIWSANKTSVRRAGGTGPLLQQVWTRLPRKKRAAYEFRASKLRREQQRLNDPEFQLAMQQTNPTPLPRGSSASVEVSMNWMTRGLVSQPVRDRQHVLSRSAGARATNSRSGGRPQSAAIPRAGSATRSSGDISRPTSAPSVALQLSASTIDASGSWDGSDTAGHAFDSQWFDSVNADGLYQPGLGAVRCAGKRETGREPPSLLRHGQNASMRIAGHHDNGTPQRGAVIVKAAAPLVSRAPSPERASRVPSSASATVATSAAVDRGAVGDGSAAETKTEEEAREEAIRYWQWKVSEGRTGQQAHAPCIKAAILEAKERLLRPNSAGSAMSVRTAASVGLVGSPPQSPAGAAIAGHTLTSSNSTSPESGGNVSVIGDEPAWSGPGLDASGLRSASISDVGRSIDALPQTQREPPVPSSSSSKGNDERRPSVDMVTQGIFARRRDRSASPPPSAPPRPSSHSHVQPCSASGVEQQDAHGDPTTAIPNAPAAVSNAPIDVIGMVEDTTANSIRDTQHEVNSVRKVALTLPDGVDDCDSQASSVFSQAKSSSSSVGAGQPRSAMESLRNFSSVDLDLVVRYHGHGRPQSDQPGRPASSTQGNGTSAKAVAVGARRRQRAASHRSSAAATRVAEARRLLQCAGGSY